MSARRTIAETHPGVTYHFLDVAATAPEQLGATQATLTALAGMFAAGVLSRCRSPVMGWRRRCGRFGI